MYVPMYMYFHYACTCYMYNMYTGMSLFDVYMCIVSTCTKQLLHSSRILWGAIGGSQVYPNLVWYAPGLLVPSFHLVVCIIVVYWCVAQFLLQSSFNLVYAPCISM